MSDLRDELAGLLDREGMTIDDLVGEACRLLPAVADRQTRYKVTDRPDVRTIRYYVTRGLLPKASGYEGGRARYGGAHLARLLLVKKLQAEHQTLNRIGRVLAGADDEAVLGYLLPEDGARPGSAPGRVAAGPPLPGRRVRRIALPGGASLDVPEEALAGVEGREALARALENAAHALRNPGPSQTRERGENP